MHRPSGPCRCRENDAFRGHPPPHRGDPQRGEGRPRGRFSGHEFHGAGSGDHDFFQAGFIHDICRSGAGLDPGGHTRPCGFFHGDGTCAAGAGLCGSDHKRGGQSHRTGPHSLETVGALRGSGFYFCQQNGSGRGGPGGGL